MLFEDFPEEKIKKYLIVKKYLFARNKTIFDFNSSDAPKCQGGNCPNFKQITS